MTRCANPECRRPLDPERVARYGARVCDAACRAAAFRARHGIRRVKAGSGAPVAREPRANGSRSGPSGLQVSFRRAVRELAAVAPVGLTSTEAERWAAQRLAPALSDRQRARLEARRG